MESLNENAQIVLRYCTDNGDILSEANPNGSAENIAGIVNSTGNVLGMMPHPERCCEKLLGGNDGLYIFESIINSRI